MELNGLMVCQGAPLERLLEEAEQFDSVFFNEVGPRVLSYVIGIHRLYIYGNIYIYIIDTHIRLLYEAIACFSSSSALFSFHPLQSTVDCAKRAAGGLMQLVKGVVTGESLLSLLFNQKPGMLQE